MVILMVNHLRKLKKIKKAANRWRKTHDESSGRDYWYHKDTDETQWDTPKEIELALQFVPGFNQIMADWDSDESTTDEDSDDSSGDDDDDNNDNNNETNEQAKPNVAGGAGGWRDKMLGTGNVQQQQMNINNNGQQLTYKQLEELRLQQINTGSMNNINNANNSQMNKPMGNAPFKPPPQQPLPQQPLPQQPKPQQQAKSNPNAGGGGWRQQALNKQALNNQGLNNQGLNNQQFNAVPPPPSNNGFGMQAKSVPMNKGNYNNNNNQFNKQPMKPIQSKLPGHVSQQSNINVSNASLDAEDNGKSTFFNPHLQYGDDSDTSRTDSDDESKDNDDNIDEEPEQQLQAPPKGGIDSDGNEMMAPPPPKKRKPKAVKRKSDIDVTLLMPSIEEEEKYKKDVLKEVVIPDECNKYLQIGFQQQCKLEDWAQQKFQKEKHSKGNFLRKKSQNVLELVTFADFGKVKHSLHRSKDPRFEEQSKQTWKNINSFMGLRKSTKDQHGHVEKLVRYGLKGNDLLRDEIFCQLCKQCNLNPNTESLKKGWTLMLICCSVFPPSNEFVDYLACFLFSKVREPGSIGMMAQTSLQALDKTMVNGVRKFVPLLPEIDKIRSMERINVDIYYVNGQKLRTIKVSPQTSCLQVLNQLKIKLEIKTIEAFGLFEMELAIPSIDVMKKRYIKRELMSQQQKINDLVTMPYERELESTERIMDIITSWSYKKKKDDDDDDINNNNNNIPGPPNKNNNNNNNSINKIKKLKKYKRKIKLVFKAKCLTKTIEKNLSNNGKKIAFLTHFWNVKNDYIPIFDDDDEFAYQLTSIALQAVIGPRKNNSGPIKKLDAGIISEELQQYLPYRFLQQYLPNRRLEGEDKILKSHLNMKLIDMNRIDSFQEYSNLIRSNKKYKHYLGNVWFRGVRILDDDDDDNKNNNNNNSNSGHNNNSNINKKNKSIIRDRDTNDFLIGIGEHGIIFVNPITQKIDERYKMEEILTFGYRSNAFLFVAGTLMTQTKFQIATMLGKQMNDLIRQHIDLRVKRVQKNQKKKKKKHKKKNKN